jgi:biotin transport system substrate-specific component
VITPLEVLWALVGLLLTIAGSLTRVQVTNQPWLWDNIGLHTLPIGISFQVGAVLLVACLGGARAGAIAQAAYLFLGLYGFAFFDQGGGWAYWQQPSFGYLVGFIPGAWICGYLANRTPNRLESVFFSCVCGLLVIHTFGLVYLILGSLLKLSPLMANLSLPSALMNYSVLNFFPGQIILACVVSVLVFFIRIFMFI